MFAPTSGFTYHGARHEIVIHSELLDDGSSGKQSQSGHGEGERCPDQRDDDQGTVFLSDGNIGDIPHLAPIRVRLS